jgi:excisionase family DNA binding protein
MNNEYQTPNLLSLKEVGERTALSRSTIYREIESGRLQAVKIGKSVRVMDSELRRYIESLQVRG